METMVVPTQTAERLDSKPAPRLRIAVHIDTEVLDPEVARRKANVWLLLYAGHLLRADCPELVINDGLFWRYDVILTSPRSGSVGKVGQIHVQADTGEVVATDSLRDEYLQQAKRLLATRPSQEQARTTHDLSVEHDEVSTTNAAAVAVR
jgi:hypothetical protein